MSHADSSATDGALAAIAAAIAEAVLSDALAERIATRSDGVPLFVEEGELIKIDTRTGEYVSRVKE